MELGSGVYYAQPDLHPLTNMPDGCYSWGVLVMMRSYHSFVLIYFEDLREGKTWFTTSWGGNDASTKWRAL